MLDPRVMICRGKRKDNGEWVEGYLFKKYFQDPPHDRFAIQYKPKYNPEVLWQPDYMAAEVDPETVGWFTGLHDSTKWEHLTVKEKDEFMSYGNLPNEWKGKKIFGGDVFEWGYAGERDLRYVIVYDAELASFVGQRGAGSIRLTGVDIEVIGNINDNPELLKEEII